MSSNDVVEYHPIHVSRAAWSDEQESILACRARFIDNAAEEQIFDAQSQHYLASIDQQFVGYLCVDNDGHLCLTGSYTERADDIAEALLRFAVLDTPRRGLSQLAAPAAHPWQPQLSALGFNTLNSINDKLLTLFLPPDRSFIASGSGLIRLETTDTFREHSLKLVQEARYGLVIFSEDLEDWLYDNDAFVDAVMALLQRQRNTSVRILVRDTRALLERGHRLLRVCHRASEKAQIRKLPSMLSEKFPNYLIVDDKGLLYRQDPQVVQGIGYHDYRARVKPLLEDFKLLWARSTTDPDLRQHTL